MENRANYAIIGAFTLAVVAGLVGFVYWILSTGTGGEQARYRIEFGSSVAGLLPGSAVTFNGIRVGEVVSLSLDPKNPRGATVIVTVAKTTPVRSDTEATVEAQPLTGISQVSLRGGAPDAPPLPVPPDGLAAIPSGPSALTDILKGAGEVMGRVDSIARRLDQMLADNEVSIRNTVKNAEKFSAALGDNAGDVATFLKDAGAAARSLTSLGGKLETLSTDAGKVMAAIDPKRVTSILENADRFSQALGSSSDDLARLVKEAGSAVAAIGALGPRLEALSTDAGKLLASIDGKKIDSILANADKFTAALGNQAGSVETMLKDASELARQLRDMAGRLDKVLANVEGLTGSGDSQGMFAEFTEAARTVRKLAENLDQRTAGLTSGLNRLTGQGLREFEALASDGRRTLGEIERVFRNFERNPQRFIFGGSSVPEYRR
jgi:phospholipid/cholesterol/gamma-HCH transport system substrate-binding protein